MNYDENETFANGGNSNINPALKKKVNPGRKLNWDIEDLKTALLKLNENDEIRHMVQIFRDERRGLLGADQIGQYRDVCEILEEEITELQKEILGEDLESFE